MKTLRELLTEYCEKNEYDTHDESLEECLRESYPQVWEGERDEHRWRTEFQVVAKIENRFFMFSDFTSKTSMGCAESSGYTFEGIDNVREVYPHQTTTTVYKNEPAE